MPMTQDRMLRLLEAGEAYEQQYKSLFNAIKYIAQNCHDPETKTRILLQLEIAKDFVYPATTIIMRERLWYQMTSKDNERRKHKMRANRAHDRGTGTLTTVARNIPEYPSMEEMKRIESETNSDLVDFNAAPMPDEGEEITDPLGLVALEEIRKANREKDQK